MKLEISDLFYLYESDDETVVALRGLHLEIASGECLVIKGPNGSGKSTLVKLLTGFYSPTAGRIWIGGLDLAQIDPIRLRREYVSSIDQRGNLIGELTALENVALAFTLGGKSGSQSRELASELLKRHGLGQIVGRYSNQLSAGERQMCSILAALATEPKILIADEPSGELDNQAADAVYALLKSAAGKTTVVLVTHDSRAESFADRVVRIRDGRISEEWLPGEKERSVIDPFGWTRVPDKGERTLGTNLEAQQSVHPHGEVLLRAEQLDLRYGDKSIFHNVDLAGRSGELIALSSTSGTGKSSLLRILAGIQDASAGSVYVGDQLLAEMSREDRAALRTRSIGFLNQGDGAMAKISLRDHVGSSASASDLFDGFASRMNRPLSGFSGGERARIELLKILSERRPILLLDEPTSQLDERRSQEIVDRLLDYVSAGALIIASTRDEALLVRANRILSLTPG